MTTVQGRRPKIVNSYIEYKSSDSVTFKCRRCESRASYDESCRICGLCNDCCGCQAKKAEKFPFRCPVWSCIQGYPFFKTEGELTLHLELVHPRSIKKNGFEKLVKESKELR